ncbi:glycosyltransferase [Paraflavisolibacter sp. H34]|uniref:glycosyltransferase n=1 Tax=Huijunlia imazamoxiresistens TaxID=3127457 RepID=UPI0030178E9A
MEISVIICTYNPKTSIFHRVLEALRVQRLSRDLWELIIIDNNSALPVAPRFDLAGHPSARVIRETRPGLSHARLAGIRAARGSLVVFVDDDNVLEENYLAVALDFYKAHPRVGCFGGKSKPVFETHPPAWFFHTGVNLGCQDYGDELHVSNYTSAGRPVTGYPEKAPIGTGMVIQKEAFLLYLNEVATAPERLELGRKGQSLSSGEDNDIVLTVVKKGYELAYVPQLVVHHLIPAKRYSRGYLEKMAFESNKTWITVLALHGIRPWKKIGKWTYGLRTAKSYFAHRAWQSPLSSIKWKASCGLFKGLAELE